jgi:hypothetical protein
VKLFRLSDNSSNARRSPLQMKKTVSIQRMTPVLSAVKVCWVYISGKPRAELVVVFVGDNGRVLHCGHQVCSGSCLSYPLKLLHLLT